MPISKMCESCIHHKLCMHDKNLMGDVFVPGNPLFFDNKELYKRYKEWEAKGFPCEDYLNADTVEVKHGRLIDADKIFNALRISKDIDDESKAKFMRLLIESPTVIEAEEQENED